MREKVRRVLATALIVFGVSAAVIAMGRAAARPVAGGMGPQTEASQVSIGSTDIGGVVTSSNGPEARCMGDRGNHGTAH